jgi:hypothetical protein
MFPLKPISHDSLMAALAKAERYRLLNEPTEAESICRDILAIEPDNQQAVISLTLALTDQIPHDPHAFANALSTATGLRTAYDRAYYAGIAWERRAKALLHGGGHGAERYAYEWIVKALHLFGDAELLRVPGNDDAVLRWNACVRFLSCHKELGPRSEDVAEPILSE